MYKQSTVHLERCKQLLISEQSTVNLQIGNCQFINRQQLLSVYKQP